MTFEEAQAMFREGTMLPSANLYEAAYTYGLSRGFDPIETGDWNQARLLLQAIAGDTPHDDIYIALSNWMTESKMMSVQEAAEESGSLAHTEPFDTGYIRAEIGRGNLKAYKRGNSWIISRRAFREWWNNPKRAQRGNRTAKHYETPTD